MIRLKSAHFHHPVGEAGTSSASNAWPPPLVPEGRYDLQVDGGFVAIFVRGNPIPRLVPMQNVRQLEPIEVPKGFEPPQWETLDNARHTAERKKDSDMKSAVKAAALAVANALPEK